MGRRPRDEFADLADTARAHIKRAKVLGKSLDIRMARAQGAADDFTVNEDIRRDFNMVTTALQHSGKVLTQAVEAKKAFNGSLTIEQLEAQFRSEIVRAAVSLADDDWNLMCEARRKAKGST